MLVFVGHDVPFHLIHASIVIGGAGMVFHPVACPYLLAEPSSVTEVSASPTIAPGVPSVGAPK